MVGFTSRLYVASARASGRKVLLKLLMNPGQNTPWFSAYVQQQSELRRRVENDPALKSCCQEFIDSFVDTHYFQVFEFLEKGFSLESVTGKSREGKAAHPWSDRLLFSRLFIQSIVRLHANNIVHSRLDPSHFFLLPDPASPGKFLPRLVNMSFALLTDQEIPWREEMGFPRQPGYLSPEHARGEIPGPPSDVFASALIISELVGGGHPFRTAADYESAILEWDSFQRIQIEQPIPEVENPSFLENVLHQCLHPDPARRPTATQVAEALEGRVFPFAFPLEKKPKPAKAVAIYFENRMVTKVSMTSTLGKAHFAQVHPAHKYVSPKQFTLIRDSKNCWKISHESAAKNATMIEGKGMTEPVDLWDGMQVGVGNAATGVVRFALTLKLVP